MANLKIKDKIEYKGENGGYLKGVIAGIRSTDLPDENGEIIEQVFAYVIQTPHKDENDNYIYVDAPVEDVREGEK